MNRKTRTRFLSLAMALLLVLSLAPFGAVTARAEDYDYFALWMCDAEHNPNTGGGVTILYELADGSYAPDSGLYWTSSTNQTVPAGTKVTLIAQNDPEYRFKGWYQANINRTGPEDPYYLADKLVSTAREYSFVGNPIGAGESPYICAVFEYTGIARYGDQIQIWVGNTDGRPGGSTVMGGKVAVQYTPSEPNVYDMQAKDGTDFVAGEIVQFYKGDEITAYAQPDEGYVFVGWYHVNIEWGPSEGKPYEGDVISTETSFTYRPGETIIAGDTEPLRYVCAVFEEAPEVQTCTVSFDPHGGTGTMGPVTVAEGETYTLPSCAFTKQDRVFYYWSVNGERKSPGDTITVTEDVTVQAMWMHTGATKIDNSVDASTTTVVGTLTLTNAETGAVTTIEIYNEVTASTFTQPSTPTVEAMLREAADALEQKANTYANVQLGQKAVSDPNIVLTRDDRAFTYFDDERTDEQGDYITRYLIIDGSYRHDWQYTVTLAATYTEEATPANPFTDVPEGQYYYEPVLWAVNHEPQITNGTSPTTFSPEATCTRGQVVTFLWRAKGEPEPESTVNPFSDVPSDAYYYKAVLWANENGITNGTSKTTFSPNDPCTRAHVVTFLWRSEGEPKAGSMNPFSDVPAGQYYTDAVLWAVSKDITNGTSPTTFSPNNPCTRGQIVTFLYRDMK